MFCYISGYQLCLFKLPVHVSFEKKLPVHVKEADVGSFTEYNEIWICVECLGLLLTEFILKPNILFGN